MENTRKIVLHLHTDTVGTDSWEFWIVPVDMPSDYIEELVQYRADNNAETYGIYPPAWDDSEDDEYADDNIGGDWYEYVPDKHDMYRVGDDDSWETC